MTNKHSSDFAVSETRFTTVHRNSPKGIRIEDKEAIERVRKRDGVCLAGLILKDGCVSGFDVHHIVHRGAGGGDTLDNMICLCRKHHNAAHSGALSIQKLREILTRFYEYRYE